MLSENEDHNFITEMGNTLVQGTLTINELLISMSIINILADYKHLETTNADC